MKLLAETLDFFPELDLMLIILIFTRISASLTLLPAFGEKAVPTRIKLVLALAFSALTYPVSSFEALGGVVDRSVQEALLSETTTGLLVGFLFRCLVFVLQICGTVAAQSVSLSQSFGAGLGVDPQPAFSTLLVVGGLALLAHAHWHIHIIQLYIDSYDLVPIGHWPDVNAASKWGISQVGWAFNLGFSLAAPFIVVSLIYNIGLGFINKAMPQLMVALVGAPAASFLGLIVLMLSAPIVLTFWSNSLLIRAFESFGIFP